MSSRHRRKQNRAGKVCISLIIVMFLAVMSVQIVNLYQKREECEAKKAQSERLYEEETQRQADLKEYENYMQSEEAIEDIAKSKLGLVFSNEIVFKEDKAE